MIKLRKRDEEEKGPKSGSPLGKLVQECIQEARIGITGFGNKGHTF